MIIYKCTNKINGKVYIGQTTRTLEKRKYDHEWCLRRLQKNNSKNTFFQRALLKYGKENFEWEVIENCFSLIELNEREKYWISEFMTMDPSKGYNLTSGGQNHYIFTDEVKQKIRLSNIGKVHSEITKKKLSKISKDQWKNNPPSWVGTNPRTKEQKERQRQTHLGKKYSEETIQKRVEKLIGQKRTEATKEKMRISATGFKHSEESRKKMSEVHKGEIQTKERVEKRVEKFYKKVYQYSLEGSFIKEFRSIKDAALEVCGNENGSVLISERCKGEGKTAYGFRWSFIFEESLRELEGRKLIKGTKVNCYDKVHNFIKTFISINEASRQMKVSSSCIFDNLKGKQKTAGGYIWEYAEN